ncbi:DsrE family protein [Thermoproteus tenax]|uniref:Peroxiredoxin family protein n=1 Tax=Thermoproteus tenax (strain ATCC 35583 / DSM 2078 / JCM 9277 / NBRC 100435 / Kra 1) TaxID=768679 RepID=G4RNH3_THETK|nr:DsrE family protein [Thermoproteus tenax]CCC81117.1 Peroxiredoxin family protein [Thermoproteus tenax Kra 1]
MKVGVILSSDDPIDLYVAGTYVATEVARGNEVVVFVTGRAVLAFAGRATEPDSPEAAKMRELRVTWRELFESAKALGARVIACETAARIFGVGEEEFKTAGLVERVTSMYTFLEEVADGRLIAF